MECHKGGCNVQFFCGGEDRDHKCKRAVTFCAGQLIADKADVNSACISSLNVANECAQNITVSNLNAVSVVANDVCIPGTLKAANFVLSTKYRASMTFSSDFLYTLGSPINWNMVLDDPNSNISFGPSRYTAPVSGYYVVSLQVQTNSFAPASGQPVLGNPIGNLELLVNGLPSRQGFSPFLSFLNQGKATISSLLSLNAGDVVTARYTIDAFDQLLGLQSVPGTLKIEANGTESKSIFKIHILSVNVGSTITCSPVLPCAPCSPMQCDPTQDCDMDRDDAASK